MALKDYKFVKGKFVSPYNEMFTQLDDKDTWSIGRLPEYLWIGFIIDSFGREKGLEKCWLAIKKLHEIEPTMNLPMMSSIMEMSSEKKTLFFNFLDNLGLKTALNPLSIFLTYSVCSEFSRLFCDSQVSVKSRFEKVSEVLEVATDQYCNFSADIRYIVLSFSLISGKLKIPKEMADRILKYPYLKHEDGEMALIRSSIRATEMVLVQLEERNIGFMNLFWGRVSEMQECNLFSINYEEEGHDYNKYLDRIKPILEYLSDLLQSTNPIDDKMLVLLGIATYSYKRFLELVEHNLFHTISGRSITRVLVEDFIMMKYLLLKEGEKENIWRDFQMYGIGQYKLIVEKHRDSGISRPGSHVNYEYMELLINEYIREDFIEMDTNYFDKAGIREKALAVNERDLYGLYYDYDSAFEHGLWGAVRESSLLKCGTPSHRFHCVPDVENTQKLKSVWHDSMAMITRTILLLDEIYGIPEHLLEGINKVYEK